MDAAISNYHQTFNRRNQHCKSYMMFCVDLLSSGHSLLRQMYLKSTCRNSGPQLRFINTPSDSKWTPESHLGRCCISVQEFQTLTDVNVNKLYQPWRSFAAVINKNVDYAFLILEDLVYQVEHKNQKKSNEMYYPRFTKVIIHHFMTKKPSIPRRNKVKWHYVRDDILFSTIKVAYKEYYACATGEAAPKPKASARKKKEAEQLKIVLRRSRHEMHISQQGGSGTDGETGSKPGVLDVPSDDSDEEISWNSSDDEDVDAQGKDRDEDEIAKIDEQEATESGGEDEETESDGESEEEETTEKEEESFDPIPRTPEESEGMAMQMPKAVREAVQIQTDRLQDSIQRQNDEFLKTIDDNMKKIIKEQVKTQVKAQVTRILPRIEESVNAQLEAKVLARSSHSSRTSYAVAADLSEMELKKILIDKIEGNKSIQRSDEQRNLYKALVKAYDADKTILDTYGESSILKRRRGEHASASTPSEQATESAGRSTTGTQSRQLSASESAFAEEPPRRPPTPNRDWNKTLPAAQGNAQSWISALAKQTDARSSFNKLLDTSIDFSNFIMNRLGVDTLTLELLAGPTYELMGGEDHRCHRLKIVEWHNYKHLDWISLRRDDDKIYKFKEGNFKRLRLQDIEDMLLLLVQGKLSNLPVEEHFAFNVSLRMFTRSIVIQRRMEDLQLGVKSYQKRLNLTKPNTYRSDLK
nr:hypothetical protein [Tanacetum cinerariifolium]